MSTGNDHLLTTDADRGRGDIDQIIAVLRRRWWLILGITLLAAAATFALSERQQKQYTATASVLFQDAQLSQQASGLQVTGTSPSADPVIMATNVQLLTQQSGVGLATARIVGHGLTGRDVYNAISASQEGQTNVANVSATYPDPNVAAAIANTFVEQFIRSQELQQRASLRGALALVKRQIAALSPQQLAGTTGQALLDRAESLRILSKLQTGGASLVRSAAPPTSPSSPRVVRNLVLGLLLGLILGLAVAFLLERLDRRINEVGDLERAYEMPLLGVIPQDRAYSGPARFDAGAADHGQNEVFRLLRAYLRFFNVDREIRTLLVASAAPGDGKTTVARNLAQAAQETGTRTLLLEADLRRPTLAAHFGLAPDPGVAEVLIGRISPHDAIRSIPVASRENGTWSEVSMDLLVAGHTPPNPAELIGSDAMADLLSWTAEYYDLVVIDTPPLSVVSDAVPLLRKVDGVILVSRLGKHTRDSAAFLHQRLVNVKAPLLGVVANGVKGKAAEGYGYGYGYYGGGDDQRLSATGAKRSRV